jgi:DNA-binding GntR family transcriptional regulator
MSEQEDAPIDYKWRVVADDIEHRIKSGELPFGTQLRVRGGLADQHDVGEGTMRKAIDELAERKLVTKLPGSGTYVSWRSGASPGQGATE